MQCTLKKAAGVRDARADLVVVFVPADPGTLSGPAADADAALEGLVAAAVADGEITGSAGSVTVLHTGGRLRARRVAVVGVGAGTADDWREAGRAAGSRARDLRTGTAALALGDADAEHATAAVVGFEAGAYRFTRYLTGGAATKTPPVKALHVYGGGLRSPGLQRAARLGVAVSAARDLVNTPGNDLTPTALAARAQALADATPGLACRVLGRPELTRLGAGALLGVARGSAEPPRMIVLRWSPPGRRAKGAEVLGLVGKAITFDSGGISIKPARGMEEMKMDMGGGAAVVEAIGLIAQMGLPVEVVGVVPSTENMPSGTATKPGDVLRAMNGRTIEVINTDAEGRLVLADALCYATATAGATRLIDFATLTGAILVALGEVYAGLFGSDADWTETVRAAGEASGDICWPMPMHPRYQPLIESKVADLANSSNKRQAGAVYAAQFLREFTDGRPWCHVDIAGTGMVGGAGTGFGVALMLHVAERMAAATK